MEQAALPGRVVSKRPATAGRLLAKIPEYLQRAGAVDTASNEVERIGFGIRKEATRYAGVDEIPPCRVPEVRFRQRR